MSSVFVDAVFEAESKDPQAFRVGARNGHRWCHMWCAPGDEAALHEIAAKIGMKREWFQNRPRFPHYDLTPGRRVEALHAGVLEVDLKEWLRARMSATVFTLGRKEAYDALLNSAEPIKAKAAGGSVWQCREQADKCLRSNPGYAVYGVRARWGVDTHKDAVGPAADWHALKQDSELFFLT